MNRADRLTRAVGDINFVKKCMERMLGFKTRGVTMVLVSHSLEDIQKLCDRALWIENHQIKMIGEPAAVVSAYTGA